MRPIEDIKKEITELTERRTVLWAELGRGSTSENADIAVLTERIDELWNELRSTRVIAAHGEPDEIKRRADRERRIEVELDRIAELGGVARAA